MTPEEIQQAIENLDNLWRTSQNNEAKELAYKLLKQQWLQENKEFLAKVYNRVGTVLRNLAEYPKALECHSKAIDIFEKIGNKEGIGGSLVNIGNVYVSLCEFEKALQYLENAILILKEIDHKLFLSNSFVGVGNIYNSLSDYPKALEYYQNALVILEEIGHKQNQANVFSNIGNVFGNFSDYPKVLEFSTKAILIFEEIGNKFGVAGNLSNIGEAYRMLSDYPKSLEFYNKSLRLFEELGDTFGVATCLLNLGSVYATKESTFYDIKQAEEYLYKSLRLAEEIVYKKAKQEIYETLHTLRVNEGKFEEALVYFKKSVEIEKEIQSEDAKNKSQLFDQRRKIEEDEKVRQLKLARFQEQEKILHNILPVKIADRILQQDTFIADHFESVSVMFMDIVGFTSLSSIAPPKHLVFLLDAIFQKADDVLEQFGLEKIKTIGDGYLAVANVTSPLEEHQKATAQAALQLLETMKDFVVNIPTDLGNTDWIKDMNDLEIRIGIHTGEVVAGIIGKNKYTYDLWGDAVNVASRMESNSEAGRIHISKEFAKAIEQHPEFSIVPRGEINIKGKGTMKTYWLEKAI